MARNGGTEKVFDLLTTEMEDAKMSLKDKFGTALYAAQSGKSLDSLVDAADDGTNVASYGGITRSTNTWFKGSYNGTGGDLSLSMIATRYDDVKSGSDKPTLLVTDEATWSAYEALLQPQARFNATTNGFPKIDGGFDSLMFRSTPLIADEYCTSGYMYFLNEKYLKVITLKHPKYPTDKMGFSVTTLREPTDQDGQVGYILWYGNLITTQPRRQGVIRSIT